MADQILQEERHSTWIVVAFVVGLLGVVVGLAGVWRAYQVGGLTQIEMLTLDKRIATLESDLAAAKSASAAARQAAATAQAAADQAKMIAESAKAAAAAPPPAAPAKKK